MFTVGQEVTVGEGRYDILGPYYSERTAVKEGSIGVITRVYTHNIHVRFDKTALVNPPRTHSDQTTVSVPVEEVAPADPNAPRPRKLGEKPEGDQFIDPNDPGLMWLWDDIAAYADKQGYCSQFDTITNTLGIPGRKRDVTITIIIGDGIEAKTTIKARSPKEARDVLTAQGITVKN